LEVIPDTFEIPLALRNAFFDWNDSAPICQELEGYLNALRLAGCVEGSSPDFREYRLLKGVAEIWDETYRRLPKEERRFFEDVVLKRAREKFEGVSA
jgi:hypothetical protein